MLVEYTLEQEQQHGASAHLRHREKESWPDSSFLVKKWKSTWLFSEESPSSPAYRCRFPRELLLELDNLVYTIDLRYDTGRLDIGVLNFFCGR